MKWYQGHFPKFVSDLWRAVKSGRKWIHWTHLAGGMEVIMEQAPLRIWSISCWLIGADESFTDHHQDGEDGERYRVGQKL